MRGKNVVCLACDGDGAFDVVDGLHRRRVERQDHHLDAMLVHLLQAKVLDVDEARPELVPYLGAEHFRVAERGFYGEVFLKRDLALHDVPPAELLARASCNDAARAVSNGGNKKAARRRLFIFTYWKPSWGLPVVACEASEGWWSQAGSNRRPPACHAGALPAELWPLTLGAGSLIVSRVECKGKFGSKPGPRLPARRAPAGNQLSSSFSIDSPMMSVTSSLPSSSSSMKAASSRLSSISTSSSSAASGSAPATAGFFLPCCSASASSSDTSSASAASGATSTSSGTGARTAAGREQQTKTTTNRTNKPEKRETTDDKNRTKNLRPVAGQTRLVPSSDLA